MLQNCHMMDLTWTETWCPVDYSSASLTQIHLHQSERVSTQYDASSFEWAWNVHARYVTKFVFSTVKVCEKHRRQQRKTFQAELFTACSCQTHFSWPPSPGFVNIFWQVKNESKADTSLKQVRSEIMTRNTAVQKYLHFNLSFLSKWEHLWPKEVNSNSCFITNLRWKTQLREFSQPGSPKLFKLISYDWCLKHHYFPINPTFSLYKRRLTGWWYQGKIIYLDFYFFFNKKWQAPKGLLQYYANIMGIK